MSKQFTIQLPSFEEDGEDVAGDGGLLGLNYSGSESGEGLAEEAESEQGEAVDLPDLDTALTGVQKSGIPEFLHVAKHSTAEVESPKQKRRNPDEVKAKATTTAEPTASKRPRMEAPVVAVVKAGANVRGVTMPDVEEEKRRASVKDREKTKRALGQSSHARWKSEEEMKLRQQFD